MDIEKIIGLIIVLNAIASVYASWKRKNKEKRAKQEKAEPILSSQAETLLRKKPVKTYDPFEPEELVPSSAKRVPKSESKQKSTPTMSTHDWLEIFSNELGLQNIERETKKEEPILSVQKQQLSTESKEHKEELEKKEKPWAKIPLDSPKEMPIESYSKVQQEETKPVSTHIHAQPAKVRVESTRTSTVLQDLRSSSSLKKAIILKTILDKPVSWKRS